MPEAPFKSASTLEAAWSTTEHIYCWDVWVRIVLGIRLWAISPVLNAVTRTCPLAALFYGRKTTPIIFDCVV